MELAKILRERILFFDGAMGTTLQNKGLKVGEHPEKLNLTDPELIAEVHRDYLEAGADIISTNTFQANRFKLEDAGCTVKEAITAGVKIAKRVAGEFEEAKYVALDLGPVGRMMKPIGNMTFDEAYEYYKEQVLVGAEAGADLVIIETIADLNEARAAVLAVKENSDLPVVCTMTFQEDGRTLTGTPPEAFVYTIAGLGADALGVNCSLGPDDLMPIVERICKVSPVPVIVQANAGIPRVENDITVFDIESDLFAEKAEAFYALGVGIIGGCCGTTPEYIKDISDKLKDRKPVYREVQHKVFACSSTKVRDLNDGFTIIGERINPTGNKKLKASLRNGELSQVVKEALGQVDAGAHVLDVNLGLPDIDEKEFMLNTLSEFQGLIDLPLQIDSSKSKVIEAALRHYPGKAIINSVNGKEKSMDRIFPIAKKYGALCVALLLDDDGLPQSVEDRVRIADKLVAKAYEHGLREEDLIIDTLVLTASAQQKEVYDTLEAIKVIKEKYNVKTVLGVSNVSFGLPKRPIITRVFYTLALNYGLDSAIMDPLDKRMMETLYAFDVLANNDVGAESYINFCSGLADEGKAVVDTSGLSLGELVIKGLKEEVHVLTKQLVEELDPLEIVNDQLVPALDRVGADFENGKIFLPQLIRSAETVGVAFDIIKETLEAKGEAALSKGKIVLATVKGDVHDIGKNLVKVLLENYGYDVVDLGKDVSGEAVLEAVKKEGIKLVGLSALMTTTVINMAEIIKLLNQEAPEVKIFVGGAVLNPEYAKEIGADYYCVDAKTSVNVAEGFDF